MKIIRRIGFSLLLVWLVFFLVHESMIKLQKVKVERKTSAFLKAIQSGDINRAAELNGRSIDIKRMEKLHQETGFMLLNYENIKAEYDDGCVCTGHVDLTFKVNGEPIDVTAIVTVSSGNKPGQICAITPSGKERGSIPELSEWNLIACGSDSF